MSKKSKQSQIDALERAIKSPAITGQQRSEMEKQLEILRGKPAAKKSDTPEWGSEEMPDLAMEELNTLLQGDAADVLKANKIFSGLSESAKKQFYEYWIEVNSEFGVDTEGKKLTMATAKKTVAYLLNSSNPSTKKSKRGSEKGIDESLKKRSRETGIETYPAPDHFNERARKKFRDLMSEVLSGKKEYKYKGRTIETMADAAEYARARAEKFNKSKPAKVKKPKMTDQDCAEALKELEARRKKYKASGRKYRTKPVSQKIAGNISTAVNQALKNVPAEKIKNDPAGMIRKMEKLEKSANEFFQDFKALLGEDYEKSEAKGELDKMADRIAEIRKKYAN